LPLLAGATCGRYLRAFPGGGVVAGTEGALADGDMLAGDGDMVAGGDIVAGGDMAGRGVTAAGCGIGAGDNRLAGGAIGATVGWLPAVHGLTGVAGPMPCR